MAVHPIGNTSKAELEFLDFVNSLEEGFEKIGDEEVAYEQPQAEEIPITYTDSEASAKEWIAQHESGGDYNAYNPAGGYYGKYQLNPTLVAYGASPAEQEIAVQKYVNERYNGSFVQAKAHWQAKGWY